MASGESVASLIEGNGAVVCRLTKKGVKTILKGEERCLRDLGVASLSVAAVLSVLLLTFCCLCDQGSGYPGHIPGQPCA